MTKTRSCRMGLVVSFELGRRLEPQGGLAAPLLAEDEGRRGVGRAAEELVPGRVVDRRETAPLEDRVGLGIFLAERVARDPVMLKNCSVFIVSSGPRSAAMPTSRKEFVLRLTRSPSSTAIAGG